MRQREAIALTRIAFVSDLALNTGPGFSGKAGAWTIKRALLPLFLVGIWYKIFNNITDSYAKVIFST
ncbi:hypothetical protein AAW31_08675 [Nitrosomonas communis]|uniref:Uncharacterized protein n=1 Tax=Nitrosomonas communis TaxID=44574 RepID=A0A0F7KGE7_9PROT|nr:hypothetical protein AAW31_08675 [Nitrosomonas communis]